MEPAFYDADRPFFADPLLGKWQGRNVSSSRMLRIQAVLSN